MKIPWQIVWSTDKAENIDLDEPENRRWWIKQVSMNGRIEDICPFDVSPFTATADIVIDLKKQNVPFSGIASHNRPVSAFIDALPPWC